MAPSQALFPFNRFTGGRKPKLPCWGYEDEMALAPDRCLPPPTVSSPAWGASPRHSPRQPPQQGTGVTNTWVKSLGIKAGPAGCFPHRPSLPGRLGAGQKDKTKKKKGKKKKTTFFQPKPLIHPPASLPEALVGGRGPESLAGRGTLSPPSITQQQ